METCSYLSYLVRQDKDLSSPEEYMVAGVDPGFFLGGGAPLRNDVTDGEVKKIKSEYRVYSNKRRPRISATSGTKKLIRAALE